MNVRALLLLYFCTINITCSVGSEIGLYFDPEDIHVMRFNESEAEFDARLESYEDQGEDDETI